MQYTNNYNLKKPEGLDVVDVNDFNINADTIDNALTPSADADDVPKSNGPAKLSKWISWFCNRIKAITGKTFWYEAPDISLLETKAHVDAMAPHKGHVLTSDVVSAASADKILKLNGEGVLPASITGDAKSLEGKRAADFVPSKNFTVTTGYISHGGTIPKTGGYSNYKYIVSLRSLNLPATSTYVYIQGGSKMPAGNYGVTDTDLSSITCNCNNNRVVSVGGTMSNGVFIGGVADYMEIAWN